MTAITGTISYSDTLYGTPHDDVIDGKGGSDLINGSDGVDTALFFDNVANFSVITLSGITHVRGLKSAAFPYSYYETALTNVEKLQFNDGIYQIPTTSVSSMFGRSSAISDSLQGTLSNDILDGRGGNDQIDGSDGVDTALFFDNVANFSVTTLSGVTHVRGLKSAAFPYSYYEAVLINVEYVHFADKSIVVGKAENTPGAIRGTEGNDKLVGSASNDEIFGGYGTDQVTYQQRAAAYAVGGSGADRTVKGADGNDTLHEVERVAFNDANLAFDLDGNAGQVYRLYKAAFGRTPDLGGLGGWIDGMDNGTTLTQVAIAFVGSDEFKNLYGANSSNEAFVKALYLNALGRAPAPEETPYWSNQLASNTMTRAQLLSQFSESAENKAAVASLISNGIAYAANSEQAAAATQGLTLTGTSNADTLYGSVGKDKITGLAGNDTLNGGANVDTAIYAGNKAAYTLTKTDTGYTVGSTAEGTDTLSNIERLQFADQVLALDTNGNAGQVYRLYQAAFHRTPDKAGLTDWVRGADQGMTLQNIAKAFIGSDEFKTLYGTNPTNDAFVTALYQNAIGRDPDAGGKDYWVTQLNNGLTKEMALIGFSESAENQAALIGVIQNGIELSIA